MPAHRYPGRYTHPEKGITNAPKPSKRSNFIQFYPKPAPIQSRPGNIPDKEKSLQPSLRDFSPALEGQPRIHPGLFSATLVQISFCEEVCWRCFWVEAPCFSRGRQRFSVAGRNLTSLSCALALGFVSGHGSLAAARQPRRKIEKMMGFTGCGKTRLCIRARLQPCRK